MFADFDPLAPENSDGANVQALGDEVAEKLRTKVGGQIEIINVIVPLVNYDEATQDRINALNVEKANTRWPNSAPRPPRPRRRPTRSSPRPCPTIPTFWSASVWTPRARRNQPAGLLAEHHGGAHCACEVTFSVFRYAWSDFWGTILMCTRSLGCAVMASAAAVTLGLSSSFSAPAPASATTVSAMTDAYTPPPSPLTVMITPLTLGLHVIEAIAEGIANAVELIATPPPIAIPAPQTGT